VPQAQAVAQVPPAMAQVRLRGGGADTTALAQMVGPAGGPVTGGPAEAGPTCGCRNAGCGPPGDRMRDRRLLCRGLAQPGGSGK
jgi:hypothetical protein